MSALCAVWIVTVANFIPVEIKGDGARPFAFLRALYGETGTRDAYQFGLAFFEAPFYGLAKIASVTSASHSRVLSIETGAVVVGLAALALVGLLMLVPVLEGLGLGSPGLALGASVFGTPLFYYTALHPGNTHTVDAVLYALLVLLIFLYFRRGASSPRLPVLMGVVVGVAFSVRYFNGALGIGVAAGLLLYGRRLHALLMAAGALVSAALLGVVAQVVAGNPFAGASPGPPSPVPVPGTSGAGFWATVKAALDKLAWEPANLPKMLFSTTHGFFLWTPITLLALAGIVRLLVKDRAHRPFLVVSTAAGLAAVVSYAFSPFWTGAGGFSDRYYTILFPLVPLGVASIIQWHPRLVIGVACAATAWSVWLAFDVAYGWGYRGDESTAFDSTLKAAHGKLPVNDLARRIYCASKLRHIAWGLSSCPPPPPQRRVVRDPGPAWVAPRT